MKKGSCINLYHSYALKPQLKSFVTFWPQHILQWQHILKRNIDYVPAMIDTGTYIPDGHKHNFTDNSGTPNIITMDIWREDTTPFNCVMAIADFIKRYQKYGRLHIFGLSKPNETTAYANIFNPLKEKNIIGETHALMKDVASIYRAADFMISPHIIATRTIREALACGCPVIAQTGNPYTPFTTNMLDTFNAAKEINNMWKLIKSDNECSKKARQTALNKFSLQNAAKHIQPILERVMESKVQKIPSVKAIVKKPKYRIYNFIAYCPSFDGKNIGKTYNEYMNLVPNDNDWACFIDHDAMFTTPNWYNQLYAIIQSNPDVDCFTAVTNRIGNPSQKFANIDKDNHDILYHRKIGKTAQEQFWTKVRDITKGKQAMSGVVILVKKSAWKEAGGFLEEGFLGIDNKFHIDLTKAGKKVAVMAGVYVYHLYRADGSTGLKPIKTEDKYATFKKN